MLLIASCVIISCNNKKTTKEESRTDTTKAKTTSTTDSKSQNDNDKPATDVTNNDASNNISTEMGWSEDDKTRFMYECETTAKPRVGATRANEYCNCMLEKLQGRYKSYAEANRETSRSEEDMNKFVDECNGH